MPVPTPWIRTYDYPELFTRGYGLGMEKAQANARIALQQQQLAQQAAQFQQESAMKEQQLQQQMVQANMEAELKRELAEKEMLQEQSRADITRAYHESQLGLQKRRLDQQAEAQAWKIKEAAAGVAAQEQYQSKVEEYKAQGMDPMKAGIRAAMENTRMTRNAQDVGRLASAQASLERAEGGNAVPVSAVPINFEGTNIPVPNLVSVTDSRGKSRPMAVPGGTTELSGTLMELRAREADINRKISKMGAISAIDPETVRNKAQRLMLESQQAELASMKEELAKIKKRREEISQRYNFPSAAVPAATSRSATYRWDSKASKMVPIGQ